MVSKSRYANILEAKSERVDVMTKVEYAVRWCLSIAEDNSHGYSQINRWGPDYDCSSLIITAYQKAGIPVKDAGATYTMNMQQAFQKCGFKVVPNWNKVTGAGLIRGDVVLNYTHHVEMYLGNNQLVKASQDEYGGITGINPGDQTSKEITTSGYYNYPWDVALRYSNQTEEYTGSETSFMTASEYATAGTLIDVEPNYKEIKCYMSTLDRTSKNVDYEALKDIGLIGTLLEAGYLYDSSHMEVEHFLNPKLAEQVEAAKKAEVQYGFYTVVRSRNVQEANLELKWYRIYLQKYTPTLGAWLKLELSSNKAMNDLIIGRYHTLLTASGYTGKMGLYATRQQLKLISWDKWQEDFSLWLIDHVDDLSEIEQILDPTFFDL